MVFGRPSRDDNTSSKDAEPGLGDRSTDMWSGLSCCRAHSNQRNTESNSQSVENKNVIMSFGAGGERLRVAQRVGSLNDL